MKPDKRSRRTKKWLLDTLLDLLQEKEYSDISITELTEKADIARRTFYRNYRSMDDILLANMDDVLDNFFIEIQHDIETETDPYWEFEVNQLINMLQQNAALFKALQKAGLIREVLDKFAENSIMIHKKAHNLRELDAKHQNLVFYHAGGVYMVLYKWLENDMKTPTNVLTDLFKKVVKNINLITKEYIESKSL